MRKKKNLDIYLIFGICILIIGILIWFFIINSNNQIQKYNKIELKKNITTRKNNKNVGILTIIITASFIPSHPSIELVKETINSLLLINMPNDTKIILAHDYSDNNKYSQYLQNLNNYVKYNNNITIVKCDRHRHLTGNIRNALKDVYSKYLLVVQHDLPFVKQIDIQKIIEDMNENQNIKYIRFNKRKNIKIGFDSVNDIFGEQQKQKNYIYTKTPAWSDNNHICLTQYYKDIIMKECPDGYPMESKFQGKINKKTHKKYGTYLFGELNHPKIIRHTDGRNKK